MFKKTLEFAKANAVTIGLSILGGACLTVAILLRKDRAVEQVVTILEDQPANPAE